VTMICGNANPEPVAPLPIDHWITRLEELRARVAGTAAALNADDVTMPGTSGWAVGVPTLASFTAALVTAKADFESAHEKALAAEVALLGVASWSRERTERTVAATREALIAGAAPPPDETSPLVAGTVASYLSEQKAESALRFAAVEEAGRAYVQAAQRARESRALLIAAKLRPIVEGYQPTIDALREAEAASGTSLDPAAVIAEFEREGFLP